jgi:putative addiction module component (TIGR02574 family)
VPLTHWDSNARNNAELPLPEWQKTELDRRYSDYKNGKLKLHNWDVIHEELGNKYK